MPWFKVDDGLPMSRKVLGIPRRRRMAAIGLWTLAGSWCARELTDGHVPAWLVEELGGSQQSAADLVAAGLWETEVSGWVFHDWHDHQPSREQVHADRAEHARRQKEYRDRKRQERDAARQKAADEDRDTSRVTPGDNPSDTPNDTAVTTARPDPTRPDPTVVPTELPIEVPPAKRGSRLPLDWQPSRELIDKARNDFPSVDLRGETDAFCDWWHAKAGKDAIKLDWNLTWQSWMRRTHQRNQERNQQTRGRYYGKPGERKSMI